MWDLICQHWRMDNLTHSLVGALLGQMGLKRKTGLAMPTLIIAANIPDIDAVAVLLGGHQHLAIRRGITHGPIAMVLLPLLLWAAMLWFDAWQTRRGKRPEKRLPVHKGWLLGLAYLGCLTHPALDWCNSYGIRLLEPFSHRWFYGDVLFIIDIWIWAALIAGVWLSLRRERRGASNWPRPAWIGLATVCAYILVNGSITGAAEAQALSQLRGRYSLHPSMPDPVVVANPEPIFFWEREILWRDKAIYGQGYYRLGHGVEIDAGESTHFAGPASLPEVKTRSKANKDISAYLFWSRMPLNRTSKDEIGYFSIIGDQRFNDPLTRERFKVRTDYFLKIGAYSPPYPTIK
jgi:inner membrane protein